MNSPGNGSRPTLVAAIVAAACILPAAAVPAASHSGSGDKASMRQEQGARGQGGEHRSGAAQASGQDGTQSVGKEAGDLLEALQDYGADQRDEAVAMAQKGMAALDRNIDQLQARLDRNWDQMSASARESARETMRALQRQRIELAEWYGGWKNSTAAAWDEMKRGFANAYADMRGAWQEASKEYGDSGAEDAASSRGKS